MGNEPLTLPIVKLGHMEILEEWKSLSIAYSFIFQV